MEVLERISLFRDAFRRTASKFCILDARDIVLKYILTDARNALQLFAITHVRYRMPHGKNKENKAYRRLIFLNLQPNGFPDQRARAESNVRPYQADKYLYSP